ncbi:helix-turn-helix domain-containing protein [Rhodobacter xanthinilyticus]|uniref:Helix-turn-helix domain-containing protein n=1 Tax=Rhodobacter xanthinilyticus TaxID=1850250 RepID=A0A1D9MCX7_9RHOB|nr:helix-turn-helix domain-containing protein [Rhodobacter xanthinilyticus]AOZ69725.1 helix-turn-helix domain-containing protein [Rhodobacter xanthinilyticus]
MIGRRSKPSTQVEDKPKGFDDFELKLGDLMRGERATLAKSLLDVQRELRIKAAYIAAIESGDVAAFETPSFIAGYVRSYARYLGMDPDWAFARFCAESGFQPTHGMAPAASGPKPQRRPAEVAEALANPNASFIPRGQAFWTKIEPRAVGSVLVLALLAGGIGYGGWSVLQEVQRVQLAPVDQAPGVVAELDPLAAAQPAETETETASAEDSLPELPSAEALDRIYRPAALDTPVLIARDGPIAAIDPAQAGLLVGTGAAAPAAPAGNSIEMALAEAGESALPSGPAVVRTLGAEAPEVEVLAVRPSWVRISAADGTVIFEKVMDAGERFALPKLAEAPQMRTGESGAIYFAVNGVAHGPVGARGEVTKGIVLSAEALSAKYAAADMASDSDLAKMVAVADSGAPVPVE